jgi:lipoprotein-releasing system ATP-binding protein
MSEPAPSATAPQGREVKDLVRTFHQAEKVLEVLRGAKLTIRPGELVAMVGPSGAGKSTLLHCVGLLERQDGGEVFIDGTATSGLADSQRTRMRRHNIGFVYQYHHLLPEFSAEENLVLPQMIAGVSEKKARVRAKELLASVGLTERADHRPARLSGGEQQRVALARGLANSPSILLADEPTGNLDVDTGERVFDVLAKLVRDSGLAALIATHTMGLASRMDRVLSLDGGRVYGVELGAESVVETAPAAGAGQAPERKTRKVWKISLDRP